MTLPEGLRLLHEHEDFASYKKMGRAIDELIPRMKDMIQKTEAEFQVRDVGLALSPGSSNGGVSGTGPEKTSDDALLKQALLEKFGSSGPGNMPWIRLIDMQIPLSLGADNVQWGTIDLLGIGAKGSLVVVELMGEKGQESPARFLLDAAVYALAVRNRLDPLKKDLLERGETIGLNGEIEVVLAAPLGYWKDAGKKMNGGRGVPDDTSEKLELLRKELARNGIRSSLVAIDGELTKGKAYAIKKCWVIDRAESASC